MTEENRSLYDLVFVESIVEEINELLLEKYAGEETMPVLGVARKNDIPGDAAIWLHIFKTDEIREKIGK